MNHPDNAAHVGGNAHSFGVSPRLTRKLLVESPEFFRLIGGSFRTSSTIFITHASPYSSSVEFRFARDSRYSRNMSRNISAWLRFSLRASAVTSFECPPSTTISRSWSLLA